MKKSNVHYESVRKTPRTPAPPPLHTHTNARTHRALTHTLRAHTHPPTHTDTHSHYTCIHSNSRPQPHVHTHCTLIHTLLVPYIEAIWVICFEFVSPERFSLFARARVLASDLFNGSAAISQSVAPVIAVSGHQSAFFSCG